jgi:hypothetical protein
VRVLGALVRDLGGVGNPEAVSYAGIEKGRIRDCKAQNLLFGGWRFLRIEKGRISEKLIPPSSKSVAERPRRGLSAADFLDRDS